MEDLSVYYMVPPLKHIDYSSVILLYIPHFVSLVPNHVETVEYEN